jgi:hypothetical protein
MKGTAGIGEGLSDMRRFFSFLVVISLLLAGCGVYTFNPRGESDLSTIAILPFENQTSQYELTDRLTEIIIDAFIADGSLKVVGESAADALLHGVLTRYQRIPHEFDENDQVQQYKVVMSFEVSLNKGQDDSGIWKETFSLEGIYDAVEETEEVGQQLAGEQLVDAVINKSTKSW